MQIQTDKPIAFFDIEATGINFRTDRIIELAIVKIHPDGSRETHEFLFNPERPIPAEASAVHGINDEDVKDCPTFSQTAPQIAAILHDCDLGGYNVIHYDIPLLQAEFERVALPFDIEGRRIVDAQKIFHKKEPRDLTAALAFYCNDQHTGAHGALSDVEATIRVLDGQMHRYLDLPRNIDSLSEFCDQRDPSWADRKGRFKWVNGELIINFGKKQGKLLKEIARYEPSFLRWMITSSFPPDVTAIARNALEGKFPEPPLPSGSTANGDQ
ncbi:MAG TPA: 3'-5' exonuclease [Kiritimatiellia bacterium]|nr:3'-5' exonuclease [Kiritimatiellia bacterium]